MGKKGKSLLQQFEADQETALRARAREGLAIVSQRLGIDETDYEQLTPMEVKKRVEVRMDE